MASQKIRERLGNKFGRGGGSASRGGGGGGGGGSAESSNSRKRSPEAIAKQKATREANAAAKKARADATGRPLERGNLVQRTRTTTRRRNEQIVRGRGSATARIRRGTI